MTTPVGPLGGADAEVGMRGRTVVFVAILLAICAAIAPLILIFSLSRQRAIESEQAHMSEYADWTLKRADVTFGRGEQALVAIERENWLTCSPEHIARMRRLTVQTLSVDEMGYFQDGNLACTSWGLANTHFRLGKSDQVLPGGFVLHTAVNAVVSGAGTIMSLTLGKHNILIRQERVVDILTDTRMVVGVATASGKLISISGKADPNLVRVLISKPITGTDGQHLYSSVSNHGLIAFAITDQSAIQSRLSQELWVLFPLGLVGSLILVGLIIWVSRQRLSLQGELAIAIKKREFLSYYQPIIELATGRCVGAEALVRWQRPDGTIVSPNFFVPLAEQVGLITDITDQLIQRVITELAVMLALEPSVHIAINIAPTDIDSGRFLPVLQKELEKAGVSAAQIWLEATERGFINAEAARKTISEARAAGYLVAIDDFGTGYSSLSMLESLPLDALKIDKSFVDAIGKGAASSVITPHIIEMAHGLRLSIVAEGVETLEQESYLRDAGVQFAQGYYYSKPLSAQDFIVFYTKRRSASVVPLRKEVA